MHLESSVFPRVLLKMGGLAPWHLQLICFRLGGLAVGREGSVWRENHMSDLYPYMCECVFKSECTLAPSRPQLPAWVGGTEGTEWMCRALPDPPLPRIGCGGNSGAGVSFVVQMLMCWGHGCVRRKEPRGERSDLAPRGPKSPSSPRETTEKTAPKAPGPKVPPFLCWGGSSTGKMPQVCLERRERGIGPALRDQDVGFGDLGKRVVPVPG